MAKQRSSLIKIGHHRFHHPIVQQRRYPLPLRLGQSLAAADIVSHPAFKPGNTGQTTVVGDIGRLTGPG